MKFPDVSQGGEGKYLCDHFHRIPEGERVLVDVGVYGKEVSNSWNLLTEGWKGLLIEANPMRIPIIMQDFFKLKYTLVNVAVGSSNTTAELMVHDRIGSSSMLPDWEPEGFHGQTITVKVRVLAELLRENGIPSDFTLLCIDVEGMDKEIIGGLLNTEFKPKVIVTEVFSYGTVNGAELFFRNRGYKLIKVFEPGNPYGNIIFVKV